MTDLIYDFITTGIDLMLIGGILSALIVMLRGSAQLTAVIASQHATTQEFDYYLQYHMYDNTEGLSSSDALSAIVGHRFDLYCFIAIPDGSGTTHYYYNDPTTGKYYTGTSNPQGQTLATLRSAFYSSSNEISYDTLVDKLDPTYIYKSEVCTTTSGEFDTEVFNRNTIVTGILITKTGAV